MISAKKSLERLQQGNRRFVTAIKKNQASLSPPLRLDGKKDQRPFAIILGCSDSRVPAELVFNQGLGDLFVIRVAGNIAAPSQVGSVEFAASEFGVRLVVVLGHTQCGAILATIDEMQQTGGNPSGSLFSIVDRIRPSVDQVLQSNPGQDMDTLVHNAIRANVRASVDHLRHDSEILERLIKNEGLIVVGAEYSLQTGTVEFFEDG